MSASIYEARRRAVEAARQRSGMRTTYSSPPHTDLKRRLSAEEIYASRRADVEAARRRRRG